MADRIQTGDDGIPRKYEDVEGDNSYYAEVVAATFGGSISVGDVAIPDGDDVALGSTADAAITSDAPGTVSGKLRGIVAILADVWDNALNSLRIQGTAADGAAATGNPVQAGGVDENGDAQALLTATTGALRIDPVGTTAQPVTDNAGSLTIDTPQLPTTIGQKAMAASTSVVVASDQSTIPVIDNALGSAYATGTANTIIAIGAVETAVDVNVGLPNDAAATTDTGDFSLISLFKRLLQKLTTQFPAALTVGGFFKVSLQDVSTLSTLSILASAARTGTTSSSDQTNTAYRRATLYVSITAAGGAFALTPSIALKNPNGAYITIWTAATPLDATGNFAYYLADSASGGGYQEVVPLGLNFATWRVTMTHGNGTSVTYSVQADVS